MCECLSVSEDTVFIYDHCFEHVNMEINDEIMCQHCGSFKNTLSINSFHRGIMPSSVPIRYEITVDG